MITLRLANHSFTFRRNPLVSLAPLSKLAISRETSESFEGPRVRSTKLTPRQSVLVRHLRDKTNPDYYYQADHPQGRYRKGDPKPLARRLLKEIANRKAGVKPGRPPKTAKRTTREKLPEREVLGQFYLERTAQTFEGRDPRYTMHELRRIIDGLSPQEQARVNRELMCGRSA